MIKVVLFDFYGVFIPDSYGIWLEKNNLKRKGEFVDLINQLDTAAITEALFLNQLSLLIGREVRRGEIHTQQTTPDPLLLELVRELQQNYTIGLFSNASKKLRVKLDHLGMTSLFDEIIISSEIGYAKPSNKAFQVAVQKLGVSAPEILFIDDNPLNVDAAIDNGLAAMRYSTVDELRTTLNLRHVL